jgi:hypothetical protein
VERHAAPVERRSAPGIPKIANCDSDGRRPRRRIGWRSAERPLWLLPQPRPVARHQLRLIRGPERIETGWWDDAAPNAIDRHYYVARLPNGARCWVFTDPSHTAWYLHGYFG